MPVKKLLLSVRGTEGLLIYAKGCFRILIARKQSTLFYYKIARWGLSIVSHRQAVAVQVIWSRWHTSKQPTPILESLAAVKPNQIAGMISDGSLVSIGSHG
jgi:hypothetical protein